MSKAITILYLEHHSAIIGGGQISLLQLLKNLDREKFNPLLVCPERGQLSAEAQKYHIKTCFIPLPSLKTFKIPTFLLSIKKLLTIVREEKVNLVHTNSSRSMMYAALLRLFRRTKVIWHVRITDKDRVIDRVLEPFAIKIITNSTAAAQRFSWVKNQSKIVTIYNGLDLKTFDEKKDVAKIKKGLSIKNEDIVIGTIAKLQPKKGIHILLDAAAPIIKKFPSIKFLIVGDDADTEGAYLKKLKSLAQQLNITEHIIFSGYRDDIPQIMEIIDIFTFPSFSESFGRSLLEAMAASKPIIASNVGGIPEVVVDGETGMLVPPGNSTGLTAAISYLLEDKNLRKEMGLKGRKRVEKLFTMEKNVQAIETLYIELEKQ
jgi:glycosyltransferase involved in cell wall biosynthesis